jgi:23S rRNA pseudouridine1911/1915/1917 synthase
MNIEILFENKNLVVINKPAGLVVHADGRTKEATLVDWILEKYPDIKEVGEPLIIKEKNPSTVSTGSLQASSGQVNQQVVYRPGIVHRLDRDTSGVLVIAKNQEAFEYLKSQFQFRETEKIYHAFVYGEMKEDDGVIDRPIARSKKDFRLWSAQRGARGEAREAVTHYKVLKRTNVGNINKGFTYIEVSPKTGRTHQIRVHMKAINHPVVADTLYAPKQKPALGFKRLALHARSLEFSDLGGERIKVEAPFPEDFLEAQKLIEI